MTKPKASGYGFSRLENCTVEMDDEHEMMAARVAQSDGRAAATAIRLLLEALEARGQALAALLCDREAQPARIAEAAVDFQRGAQSTARAASQVVARSTWPRLATSTEDEWFELIRNLSDEIRPLVTILKNAWEAGTTPSMRTDRRPRLIAGLAAFVIRYESSGGELTRGALDRDTRLVTLTPGRVVLRHQRPDRSRPRGLALEFTVAFDPDDVRAHFTVTAMRATSAQRRARKA